MIKAKVNVVVDYCQSPEMMVRQYLELRGYVEEPKSWPRVAAMFELRNASGAVVFEKVGSKHATNEIWSEAFEIIKEFYGKDVVG